MEPRPSSPRSPVPALKLAPAVSPRPPSPRGGPPGLKKSGPVPSVRPSPRRESPRGGAWAQRTQKEENSLFSVFFSSLLLLSFASAVPAPRFGPQDSSDLVSLCRPASSALLARLVSGLCPTTGKSAGCRVSLAALSCPPARSPPSLAPPSPCRLLSSSGARGASQPPPRPRGNSAASARGGAAQPPRQGPGQKNSTGAGSGRDDGA